MIGVRRLAGIVQVRPRCRIQPGRTARLAPQLGSALRVSPTMQFAEIKTTPRRSWAVLAAAVCLLAALVAAAAPRAADSAPLRVLVRGQTSETPSASCPGKIVNNVEITPCRVEGHVTGFQSIADGVAKPYEVPFDGKIVAWSITLAKPSAKETDSTTNEIGFFNEFLGTPSEARIGILKPIEDSKP